MEKRRRVPALDDAHGLVVGIGNHQHVDKLPRSVTKDAQGITDLLIKLQHCVDVSRYGGAP